MKIKLEDLVRELRMIQKSIQGESDADEPVEVRLQVLPDEGIWELHWGDPCWDTDHRGFWGAGFLSSDDDLSALRALARDLLEEARDHAAQCDADSDF